MLASPTLNAAPTPATVPLGTNSVTLTDTASLAGGVSPTGTITFTLIAPGGATVDTETVAVNGDGTYTTPTGFTLPSSGTVTGTYQWNATYSGDSNNNAASDVNSTNEQVTVSAASGQNGGANGGTAGANGGSDSGQNGGANGGADNGHNSGSVSGSDSGQNGGAAGGQNGGANGSTGPTVPTNPSEPMVPVAPQLPPLASGIDSPVVGGLTGQPNAVGGNQLPSLPGAPPARDLAFLPQQGKAPSASGVNSLVAGALLGQVNAVGTARSSSLSGAVQVRDLAFLPRDFVLAGARLTLAAPGGGDEQAPAAPGGSNQTALADHGSTDQVELAEVQGVVFGDYNRDGVWDDGEPLLSGRAVRLVKGTGEVVAETRTGPEGEYVFVGVPAGQYRVEVEGDSEWAGQVSPAFAVGTKPVTLSPLGEAPVVAVADPGEAPAEAGAPTAEGPAAVETSSAVTDLVWLLLGGVTVQAFRSRRARRSAPAARGPEL
jgi:hypothetical protein